MRTTETATTVRIARELFVEAYEGATPQWSWFVNVGPDHGVFGSVEPLTAEQASRPASPGGRSVAAHVEHLRWSLAAVNDVARGKPWQPDWSASWSVESVTDIEWDDLRAALRREYELVLEAIDAEQDWSDEMKLKGICAMAPHAAHHLGAIRAIAGIVAGGHA